MSTTDESEPITLAKLERSIDRVALAMRRAGKKGEVYLPIFERLESEIAAARAKEATLERARQRCEAQAGRPVRPAGNLQAIRGLDSEDEDQKVTGPTNPDDAQQPKNTVPLKDRLSWSPEEAAVMTGIGIN
jgi:hypothetical protein